jgi:hypothetical protein
VWARACWCLMDRDGGRAVEEGGRQRGKGCAHARSQASKRFGIHGCHAGVCCKAQAVVVGIRADVGHQAMGSLGLAQWAGLGHRDD